MYICYINCTDIPGPPSIIPYSNAIRSHFTNERSEKFPYIVKDYSTNGSYGLRAPGYEFNSGKIFIKVAALYLGSLLL